METPKKFNIVCRVDANNEMRSHEYVKHEDYGEAIAEAQRLASINPGVVFAVMQSIVFFKGAVKIQAAYRDEPWQDVHVAQWNHKNG